MKERPMLFNDAMVRAILSGTKTQTRRMVKDVLNNNRLQLKKEQMHVLDPRLPCPFGQPGDRLWVRECFHFNQGGAIYDAAGGVMDQMDDELIYRASSPLRHVRWTPSIHMPRWACRLVLEIVCVRVERLQDISEEDAKAEGLSARSKDGQLIKYGIPDRDGLPGNDNDGWHWQEWDADPRIAFKKLWSSVYGEESWNANPWVWVIKFRKVAQ